MDADEKTGRVVTFLNERFMTRCGECQNYIKKVPLIRFVIKTSKRAVKVTDRAQ
ncbi:hypothetical protein GCM10011445_36870 [Pseudocitrobacter faecalis]|nr:hypothetical protein GCM10011445_36870 [Pseudocitrobacter faecalis]